MTEFCEELASPRSPDTKILNLLSIIPRRNVSISRIPSFKIKISSLKIASIEKKGVFFSESSFDDHILSINRYRETSEVQELRNFQSPIFTSIYKKRFLYSTTNWRRKTNYQISIIYYQRRTFQFPKLHLLQSLLLK